MKQYPEFQEQASFFKWCRLACKNIPDLIAYSYIDKDGYKQFELSITSNNNTQKFLTKASAGRHKKIGSGAGIPDIFLHKARKGYHGLYIEFKAPEHKPKTERSKGGLSDHQIKRIECLKHDGYMVSVCYSWIEARDILIDYLGVK